MNIVFYYMNLCTAYNEKKNDGERLANNYTTVANIYCKTANKPKGVFMRLKR